MASTQVTCPLCHSSETRYHLNCKDHLVSDEEFNLIHCNNCGLVFTQDAPGPDKIGRYYQSQNYISHSDTKQGLTSRLYHIARQIMLPAKRKTVQQFTGKTCGKLLDFGSGTGYFIRHMADHGWGAQGIEIDDGARNYAKEWTGLTVEDPETLSSLPDNHFDVITLWHVLEHIHDLQGTLSQFHRILKKDGNLVLALPNYTSLDAGHYKENWAAYDVPRHLWHFSPDTVRHLLSDNGFRLEKLKPLPFDAFYISMLSEKYVGHSLSHLRGALIGFRSWLHSQTNPERSSSLTYIARKN